MASEEIEKLKARVERDPGSKLFVPLAEEYRKAGLFDDAINLLLKGLHNHPDYTTARVLLGRVYLEKGYIFEALKQFEDVIDIKPDNLFARKKIAEIYREIGDQEKAARHYKAVLELNPMDTEAKEVLSNLDGMASDVEAGVPEAPGKGTAERDYKDIIRKADESISSGEYMKGLGIYADLIREYPDDRGLRQRALELRQYMRIMGRDVDVLIERLESFLEGIKRRRDEFSGIS